MNGAFNRQIFVDKLAKLNSSQQSIETLSHWCIFHRNKAKQVVETWERQFHCSPHDQRVPYLYLANDILQNSRRKGMEFVGEFWKVLPDALNDVIENGDEFGRKAVLRLVGIWEERKVFGSRGQVLKEELLERNSDRNNRNGKTNSYKLKQGAGVNMEKLVSCYEHACDSSVDEDELFGKCHTSISYIEKVEKEIGDHSDLGKYNESGVLEELQGQQGILSECMDKLKAAELSRSTLLTHLREAILEQEMKMEQVRLQLEAAQSRYDQADNICKLLLGRKLTAAPNHTSALSDLPVNCIPETPASTGGQSTPATVIQQQAPFSENAPQTEEALRKTAAAEMAAKLTASTDSAQMLSYVLSSLVSEGAISQLAKEDYPSENKRPKIDSGNTSPYIPEPVPQPFGQLPLRPSSLQPPPPMLPTLPQISMPAPPATEFALGSSVSRASVPYIYGSTPLQRPLPMTSYPMVGVLPYPIIPQSHQNPRASEGHPQPPSTLSPISQQ